MIKKVGLLFSLSGTISLVGKGQLMAALMAIDEVNKNTDLTFKPIIRDDKSSPDDAVKLAYSLFTEDRVDVIIGCYMSSIRNSVISALNETGGLLLYPTLYEGNQVHPNIFYLGAVPNQQVMPLLCWTFHNISSNFVLVGSDYIYPRSTNQQARYWVENSGGKILLESYFPLGCASFGAFFRNLKKLTKSNRSAVVFSTLVGTSVPDFYAEFKRNMFSFPIVSPLTSEREISLMAKDVSSGHICASPYFQTIDTEFNNQFVDGFRRKFNDVPISREMMTTYGAVHQLFKAYKHADVLPYGNNEAEKMRMVLKDLYFLGPQGKLIMAPNTQHLWQWCHIGRINKEGEIDVIWSSPGPIPPEHDGPNLGITIRCEERKPIQNECTPLIGLNQKFLDCVKVAEIAAATSSSVLITGATGTGKELLARYIHLCSTRRQEPFVAINCASIPRDLMEAELFGYDEGAFTGAKKKGNPGKFELGNGGTLFLDEIGEMSRDLQSHLLRVIEDKQISRIGGTKVTCLDVRFIAATNKNLELEIIEGYGFRCDLFYRLSVFHIHLPLLCERLEDIPLLANHFLWNFNRRGRVTKHFNPEALCLLKEYEWPGNVRELANYVERSFHLSGSSQEINPHHLPAHLGSGTTGYRVPKPDQGELAGPWQATRKKLSPDSRRPKERSLYEKRDPSDLTPKGIKTLMEVEEDKIRQTLRDSWFNISEAARILGIGRSTLYRKLKRYHIDPISRF
ncbi:MAG: transporter substrate-binding protein [Deltaproteobacteria bacterium]|nr:transporter substrate-binding protein [Deltaproteobacteria bacterium]